tara:strand:- start:768 stop:959 length:192 start_codon:yes stop_codon:yes gene_type:complete
MNQEKEMKVWKVEAYVLYSGEVEAETREQAEEIGWDYYNHDDMHYDMMHEILVEEIIREEEET